MDKQQIEVEKWKKEMDRIVKELERERKRKRKKINEKRVKQIKIKENTYNVPYLSATNFSVKSNVTPVKFNGKKFGGSKTVKRGFAKVQKYKKTNVKHAMHVLRIDTERQGLSNRPAMMISSEGYNEEEIGHKILQMHELDMKKTGGRKQTVAYLEIFCAYEDVNTLKNYINHLAKKYNTEVFAVVHDDESVEHVHILINWKTKNGKSLRMNKGEFRTLWRDTIKTLQPSRQWNFPKGEGLKPTPFWGYLNAWRQGQQTYEEFVKRTWKTRELFYEFEQENPGLIGKWKRLFFNEWLQEYDHDPLRRALQRQFGVVSAPPNANASLRDFTSLTDTTHDTETPNDEIPNDKLNSQDAAAPLHPEDRNKTDLDVDTDIDLAVDDPTTIQKETLGDRLEKEKDIFDEIEEIFRKEETMKETSLLEQQERERMERERMEKEEIERKKNSQNVEEVFVGVIKDILNTTQKTLQKGLRVGKDIAVDTNEIDKMLGLNEQEHPAETKEKKDTVFKRPEQSRSVFLGKKR